jgi:competence protein ComEC
MLGKALAFCAGTAAIHLLPSVGAASLAAVPAVAAACLIRRRPALAAFLAGCAVGLHGAAATIAEAWPCARDRELVALEGRIAGPAIVRPDRTEFDVEVAALPGVPAGLDRVRLSWYEAQALPRAGERWRLGARLRCPRGFANPGAADRELALLREGIDATGYVAGTREPERLSAGNTERIERLRERVAGSIARVLDPGASTAVLQGLAVGLRSNMPDSVWEALAATGLAHLVAISGLHVTGCALAVLVLLRTTWHWRLLPATRWRPAVEATTVVIVTSAYALLSGASLPALRTVAMVGLFHALRALRRSVTAGEALALAAAVLVATDPLAVSSAAFWLSFVATAGLLSTGSAAPGWRGHAGQFARAQVAVTLVLAPVLAATIGRLSIVAPILNAIAIPAFSVLVLPTVLLGAVLALVSPDAPAVLWQLLAFALDALWPQLERIARWPATSFAPAAQSMVVVAGAGILVLAALMVPLMGLRVVACVVLVALACGRGAPVSQGGFTLTVLDVGQGQAAVVETAAHALVFDTGPRWRGGVVAARVSLLPFLRARGIRRIDRLIVSHEDADHAGGAEVVEQAFDVALRIAAPAGRNTADMTCVAGDGWDWDGIAFRVLHPPAGFEGDDNERACAIHVRGVGGSALLLADPEAAAEAALSQQPVAADVVLVPHHGSKTSSSSELVAAVSARVGIVSAGFGNRWNLPRAEVVERWRAAGATVLNTAGQGAVRIRFAPGDAPLAIEAVRRDEPRWWRAGNGR